MKKKIFSFILIFIIVLGFGFCLNSICLQPSKILHAEEVTDSTPITDDGTLISKELWTALESFYNANKTEETSGRIHRESNSKYFYTDLFDGFTVTTRDLSSKNITSIYNLDVMDLSPFDTINLSKNSIEYITSGLQNITTIQNLNLSENTLRSFSYNLLNESVYHNSLLNLDLSNNEIEHANLEEITQGEIDLRLNKLTKSSLILPQNLNVKVFLSHNLIDNPDTSNENLYFGFQGAKNNGTYVVGQNIYFYGFDEITLVKIYSLTKQTVGDEVQEIETEIETLNQFESYEFALGYYRIKFVNTETEDPMLKPISIYICPPTPTIEMYIDGIKQDVINYQLFSQTTIKIIGEEGATFAYSINGNNLVYENELKIEKSGINILTVYQIIDGYRSQGYQIFLTYKPSTTMSWVLIIGGALGFALIFYLVIALVPKISSIKIGSGKTKKDTKDLD